MTGQELNRAMLRTMHRARRINAAIVFEPLTRSEFFALEIMQGHSNDATDSYEGIYVSAIAEKLEVTPPSVSRMLRGMEEKGLIERVTDRNDRRNTRVTATVRGKEACENTRHRFEQYLDHVAHSMGEGDLVTMITMWNKILDIMQNELEKEQGEVINV